MWKIHNIVGGKDSSSTVGTIVYLYNYLLLLIQNVTCYSLHFFKSESKLNKHSGYLFKLHQSFVNQECQILVEFWGNVFVHA